MTARHSEHALRDTAVGGRLAGLVARVEFVARSRRRRKAVSPGSTTSAIPAPYYRDTGAARAAGVIPVRGGTLERFHAQEGASGQRRLPDAASMPVYFPEPAEQDGTWGVEEEGNVEWLRRSTLPRAVSIRRALNENLSRFEEPHASKLAAKLAHDWKSNYFELLAGRFLQVLAGRVDYQPLGTNKTRIDYRVTSPEGAVAVEAVSRRMNLHAVRAVRMSTTRAANSVRAPR